MLEGEVQVLTPAMLAGIRRTHAHHGGMLVPELRAQTLKGLMRFWFRAAHPAFTMLEPVVFGAATVRPRKASFLLSLYTSDGLEAWDFDRKRFDHFNEPPGRATSRTRNGFAYCAFPFGMDRGGRAGIKPGKPFAFSLRVAPGAHRGSAEETARLHTCIGLSLWLALHLGGIGARSRRGFGSLQLTSLRPPSFDSEVDLSPLPEAVDPDEWIQTLSERLVGIRSWLGGFASGPHPHLSGARMRLLPAGFDTWEEALNAGGRALQDFRQRRDPDYGEVKAHLCSVERKARCSGGVKPKRLSSAPARAAFGLPLTFRYGSVRIEVCDRGQIKDKPAEVTFTAQRGPKAIERSASPIHLRIVRIRRRYHPLFLWLPSDLLPDGAHPVDSKRYRAAMKRDDDEAMNRHRFDSPAPDILEDFWASLPVTYAWGDGA